MLKDSVVLVGLPTGAGPRCDRGGSRGPRIPGAGRPSNRSMPSPFAWRAMRIIGMGCQTVLASSPHDEAVLEGRVGGVGEPTTIRRRGGYLGMEDAGGREIRPDRDAPGRDHRSNCQGR